MQKNLVAASMLALTVAVVPACASKGFVRSEVGNVNQKVDTLAGTVEETQERTRRNEERIGAVDQKAEAAGRSADAAGRAAADARTAADAASANARAVGGRVDEVIADSRRLVFEVTLNEAGNFTFGQATLPDAAKAELDQLVTRIKSNPQNLWIEIEGHTDNVGSNDLNHRLGLERAEAVKRYLYEQHQLPLHKMNVISYGPDRPTASNATRDGRAQNRRVVVKVLT